MKKRILTIIMIMLVSMTSLTGCQNIITSDSSIKTTAYESAISNSGEETNTKAIEEKKEEIKNKTTTVIEKKKNTSSSNNYSNSTVSETDVTNSVTTSVIPTQIENSTSISNNSTESQETILIESQYGYTFELPKSWEGKYNINEGPLGLTVSFKTSEPVADEPWFFWITTMVLYSNGKFSADYDPILSEPKVFTVGTSQFYVAGPTSTTLSDKSSDYATYIRMNNERAQIIDSIKVKN